MCEDARTYKP